MAAATICSDFGAQENEIWHCFHFSLIYLSWSNGTGCQLSEYVQVQFSSVAQSCPTLCDPINCSVPGLPVHHQPLEFTQTHIHPVGKPSKHLILCHPLLLLPSIFPSIRVFSYELALHIIWPRYWSFSFSTNLSNEYLGLISFRIEDFDSPCCARDSRVFSSTILWKHQFFGIQPSLWFNTQTHTFLLENP